MNPTTNRIRGVGALLLCLVAALYSYRFGQSPLYFGGDEAHFGVQSHALAHSGRDLNGRPLPLFFNLRDPSGDAESQIAARRWYQPTLFYLTAVVLRVSTFSEFSVRLPALLIGLLNLLLIYAVAWHLFRSEWLAAGAALMLAFTPAHMIFSRQATDYICIVPCVLGWLWCIAAATKGAGPRVSFLAGAILGVGLFSYIAAWIVMPALLVILWVSCTRIERPWRHRAVATIGFALFAVPLGVWLLAHPEMMIDTVGRYRAAGGGLTRFDVLVERVATYWDYFDPSFFFLKGGISPTTTTGRTGVFLLPLAVFLPLGVYSLSRGVPAPIAIALIGAALIAPLPAALIGERYMIQRALAILPIAVLVATLGVRFMLGHSRRAIRSAAGVLLALVPLQFAYFYRDYFSHYELRSAFYFDPGAIGEVTAFVLASDAANVSPAVYLSRQLDDVSARWRFYLTKHGRSDLLARTRYFDGDGLDLSGVERGSLIVMVANGANVSNLLATGKWSIEKAVKLIDGSDGSIVLRKVN